jgi:maltodextrin utilization protein YvdJ
MKPSEARSLKCKQYNQILITSIFLQCLRLIPILVLENVTINRYSTIVYSVIKYINVGKIPTLTKRYCACILGTGSSVRTSSIHTSRAPSNLIFDCLQNLAAAATQHEENRSHKTKIQNKLLDQQSGYITTEEQGGGTFFGASPGARYGTGRPTLVARPVLEGK